MDIKHREKYFKIGMHFFKQYRINTNCDSVAEYNLARTLSMLRFTVYADNMYKDIIQKKIVHNEEREQLLEETLPKELFGGGSPGKGK